MLDHCMEIFDFGIKLELRTQDMPGNFQSVNKQLKVFKPKTKVCKNKNGNIPRESKVEANIIIEGTSNYKPK